MKKFLLVIAAVAAFAFVGCDKSDDEKKVGTLAGTTWEGTFHYSDEEFETLKLEFRSDDRVILTETESDIYGYAETESYYGTYSVDGSVVTMRLEDGDWIMTGRIEGNSMDIYDEGIYWITLNKK